MNTSINEKYHDESQYSLGRLFRLILMQSKLVALIVVLMTGFGIYSFISADRIYQVKSLLQILPNQNTPYASSEMELFLGSQNTTDLNVIEDLYTSRSNLLKVISYNHLNLTTPDDIAFDRGAILKFEPQKESMKDFNSIFYVSFSEDKFSVFDNEERQIGQSAYNEELVSKGFVFNFKNSGVRDKTKFIYRSPEKSHRQFANTINFKSSNAAANSIYGFRNSGLLEVSLTTKNPIEGKRILDYSNNLFINNNIELEAETARKAINFIDERRRLVLTGLQENKKNLSNFREINKSVNVDLEIESIINSVTRIEEQISQTELEISRAAIDYTSSNPLYLDLVRKKDTLIAQKSSIESRIQELPISQQTYIDLYREVEASQAEYDDLQIRKLELSIKEASTLGNIRIIDSAYESSIVSPTLATVILAFLMSIILGFGFAVIRGLFFLPISNPAEIADGGVYSQIVGVIPLNLEDESERLNQANESLLVNIMKIEEQNKFHEKHEATKLLLTSPTAANGKSFLSRLISKKLSLLGKKVLLLDNDWKRGDQHKEFNRQKISLRDFEDINAETIGKYEVSENLFVVPRISRLASSFQFLNSPTYLDKIKFFEKEFDYIVFDTAPILSVSDTSMLLSLSDINVFVARHGLSKINEIRQVDAIANQIGIQFDGIIYNAYQRPSSYYGYYGLYGNYNYQYYANKYLYNNYEYNKDN